MAEPISEASCKDSDLERDEKCGTEDQKRTWKTQTLQELEEVSHSAPRSCRHGDELGLWQLGITYVLNAAHGKLCCKVRDDFYGTTVKYHGVPAKDLPTFDLSPFFYPASEFIHQAFTSGVLAYLMIHHHLSLLSSTRCVQQKGWIFPNRGFLRQLIALL
ncbi:dual specificity protein phosphatase 13 isoform A-like [Notothenia coriiceps]|uniref:Dual specificity protein phosphatase n=1 Tax=Notothenia coriiceps TaxID=8208 RepID=A0A6I9NER3_9TELE|nr:PREDICTED: dual specificity protein phosphatase 13 isoform A-like [Notothenia coriiceps]